jgi:hypothetical protein
MQFIKIIATIMLVSVTVATLMSIPVWLLWNWLMPEIFGLKTITIIQAFGVSVLSAFLFKSSCKSKG